MNINNMRFENFEISPFKSIKGWKEIPIEESDQPFVRLNDLSPKKIIVVPEYYNEGMPGAEIDQFLRGEAATKLLTAADILQTEFDPSLQIVVLDAFRPLIIQENLYQKELERVRKEHPDWNDDQLNEEAQRFVSIPSAEITKPSPHSTGGAVDITVYRDSKEILLSIAGADNTETAYIDEARTDFYEQASDPKGIEIRDNRRMLTYVMLKAGFTNYPEEWWHFDFGNQFWAFQKKVPAIYGSATKYHQNFKSK